MLIAWEQRTDSFRDW